MGKRDQESKRGRRKLDAAWSMSSRDWEHDMGVVIARDVDQIRPNRFKIAPRRTACRTSKAKESRERGRGRGGPLGARRAAKPRVHGIGRRACIQGAWAGLWRRAQAVRYWQSELLG